MHPAKAAVVRTQQTSRLTVQFDGQSVKSDITAVQVAFWNAGRKPIRASDVLSSLVIRTDNKERILEASLRKTSREVVGITLNSSRLAAGEVELGWKILEQNDGGVLQIIFEGDETADIQAHAILEGQPAIVKLEYSGKRQLRTSDEEELGLMGRMLENIFFVGGFSVVMVGFWLLFLGRGRRRPVVAWTMLIQGAIMLAMGIWFLLKFPPGPPFGF